MEHTYMDITRIIKAMHAHCYGVYVSVDGKLAAIESDTEYKGDSKDVLFELTPPKSSKRGCELGWAFLGVHHVDMVWDQFTSSEKVTRVEPGWPRVRCFFTFEGARKFVRMYRSVVPKDVVDAFDEYDTFIHFAGSD